MGIILQKTRRRRQSQNVNLCLRIEFFGAANQRRDQDHIPDERSLDNQDPFHGARKP